MLLIPWAIGPAFNNGWWLKNKTKKDWIEQLNNCDFIYISHNHPDHLHKITLSKVRKDMLFLVPNFISDSTGIYLEHLGFKNIFRANFLNEYSFKDKNQYMKPIPPPPPPPPPPPSKPSQIIIKRNLNKKKQKDTNSFIPTENELKLKLQSLKKII